MKYCRIQINIMVQK